MKAGQLIAPTRSTAVLSFDGDSVATRVLRRDLSSIVEFILEKIQSSQLRRNRRQKHRGNAYLDNRLAT